MKQKEVAYKEKEKKKNDGNLIITLFYYCFIYMNGAGLKPFHKFHLLKCNLFIVSGIIGFCFKF